MIITFHVPAVPVAQPRQRHRSFTVGQGSAARTITQNYTPSRHPVQGFKAAVQLAAMQAYQGPPLEGPISLQAVFVLPRPKKFCRKKDAPGRLWCVARPDGDNLIKSVKDALKSMTWKDDSQVCRMMVTKCYAARDEQPGAEVTVEVME